MTAALALERSKTCWRNGLPLGGHPPPTEAWLRFSTTPKAVWRSSECSHPIDNHPAFATVAKGVKPVPGAGLTPDHLRRPNGDSDGQGPREDQLWKLAPFGRRLSVDGWIGLSCACLLPIWCHPSCVYVLPVGEASDAFGDLPLHRPAVIGDFLQFGSYMTGNCFAEL